MLWLNVLWYVEAHTSVFFGVLSGEYALDLTLSEGSLIVNSHGSAKKH